MLPSFCVADIYPPRQRRWLRPSILKYLLVACWRPGRMARTLEDVAPFAPPIYHVADRSIHRFV